MLINHKKLLNLRLNKFYRRYVDKSFLMEVGVLDPFWKCVIENKLDKSYSDNIPMEKEKVFKNLDKLWPKEYPFWKCVKAFRRKQYWNYPDNFLFYGKWMQN